MCPVIQTRSISMMKIIKDEPSEEAKPAAKKPPPRKPRKKKQSGSRVAKKKRRKPKFLSLRSSRLSVRNDAVSAEEDDDVDAKKEELELFPLRPEMMDDVSDDDVAMLFESDGGATLQGLLTSSTTSALTVSSESNYGFEVAGDGGGHVDIVRTAMRGRSGGDRSSEKWVCYSELVKEEVDLTATAATTSSASAASTCCSVGADDRNAPHRDQRQLALKLDYVEVLNAWSDKGSLFIKTEDGESPPQTVPDLLQDQLFHHLHDSNANIEDLWRVSEEGDGLASKKMQRQESLLRYKRKRESRLFSKQIRYEVRKLNAEKRPRVRGRFVRKS